MDPLLWGPPMWSVLFHLAQTGDGASLKEVVSTLQHLLPCSHCRASFQHFCRKNPPSVCLSDPVLYVWTLKDSVNQKLKRYCIPYRVFRARLLTADYAGATNAVHTLCYVCRNIKHMPEGEQAEANARLRELFDAMAVAFHRRDHPGWGAIADSTRGDFVQDAVFKAHQIVIGGTMSTVDRWHSYDAALPPPPTGRIKLPGVTVRDPVRVASRYRNRSGAD